MVDGTLLVTGARGFVGRHLAVRAELAGWRVVCTEGDLTLPGVARRAVREARPDAVIHLAAAPRGAGMDRWASLGLDLRLASAVLSAVARHAPDAVVLGTGSAAQYGAGLSRPLTETDPIRPLSPYGASKAVLEQAFLAEPLAGPMRTIWCRSFNHAGPGQGPDAPLGHWVRQLVSVERSGGGAVRTGSLQVVRDVLDVRDVADAYLALIAAPEARGVVNVCSGRPVRLRELADLVLAHGRGAVSLASDPALVRPFDPPFVVGDPSRLRSLTDWVPSIPMERTISDMVAEVRAAAGCHPATV